VSVMHLKIKDIGRDQSVTSVRVIMTDLWDVEYVRRDIKAQTVWKSKKIPAIIAMEYHPLVKMFVEDMEFVIPMEHAPVMLQGATGIGMVIDAKDA